MSDCFDHMADAYDDLLTGRTSEGDSYRYRSGEPFGKTCKYCGTPYLHWLQKDGRWCLTKNGAVHVCPPQTTANTDRSEQI